MKSSMLIIGRCLARSWILCITRHKPWWRLSSINIVISKLGAEVPIDAGTGGGGRADVEEAGAEEGARAGGVEEDGPSDP